MAIAHHILQRLALAAFLSVVYTLAGPLVDHHFPERLPFHGHLFVTTIPGLHQHELYQPHAHSDGFSDQHGSVLFTVNGEGYDASDSLSVWQIFLLASLLALAPKLFTYLAGLIPSKRLAMPVLCPYPPPPKGPRFAAT